MSDGERIQEYNRTIKHKPVPTDFAIRWAAKEYYDIEVESDDEDKIENLRQWMYNSLNPVDGPASVEI